MVNDMHNKNVRNFFYFSVLQKMNKTLKPKTTTQTNTHIKTIDTY